MLTILIIDECTRLLQALLRQQPTRYTVVSVPISAESRIHISYESTVRLKDGPLIVCYYTIFFQDGQAHIRRGQGSKLWPRSDRPQPHAAWTDYPVEISLDFADPEFFEKLVRVVYEYLPAKYKNPVSHPRSGAPTVPPSAQ